MDTTTHELPPHVSIQQAATWLDVDPKTIRRYIAAGTISAKRIGPRLIRVERDSLAAFGRPLNQF
ncbi:helix-turn-helix domain-containing protein [Mycobacterium sp. 236(2023)]|uniref:helix-turn-helix domain-containing protein n=1 Tax=Mycobacterium sp. 236(2023) TaxID=3038163 RepID=UPI002414E33D|nr:helix-turn-helix domain-containing protein [Mycobacterium sp. 236(2023)]MDG4665139.1 helix-turn-helix domain-containing protein [Mycobacterium sp. 236(2023)]